MEFIDNEGKVIIIYIYILAHLYKKCYCFLYNFTKKVYFFANNSKKNCILCTKTSKSYYLLYTKAKISTKKVPIHKI